VLVLEDGVAAAKDGAARAIEKTVAADAAIITVRFMFIFEPFI
jgi:hypothetical protein